MNSNQIKNIRRLLEDLKEHIDYDQEVRIYENWYDSRWGRKPIETINIPGGSNEPFELTIPFEHSCACKNCGEEIEVTGEIHPAIIVDATSGIASELHDIQFCTQQIKDGQNIYDSTLSIIMRLSYLKESLEECMDYVAQLYENEDDPNKNIETIRSLPSWFPIEMKRYKKPDPSCPTYTSYHKK